MGPQSPRRTALKPLLYLRHPQSFWFGDPNLGILFHGEKKNKTPKWFSEHSDTFIDAGNFSGKDPDKVQLSLTLGNSQRTPSPALKVSAALKEITIVSQPFVFFFINFCCHSEVSFHGKLSLQDQGKCDLTFSSPSPSLLPLMEGS